MRFAFFNNGLPSQLATKRLVEKHDFKEISMQKTLSKLKKVYFDESGDEVLHRIKTLISHIDKTALLKYILNQENKDSNIIFSDITTLTEHLFLLNEDFVPVLITGGTINYDPTIDKLPILKLTFNEDLDKFNNVIDSFPENYATLAANKFNGGSMDFQPA
jgi:hypothetical protein